MSDVTKTTTLHKINNKIKEDSSNQVSTSYQTAGFLIYFIFGILNVLLTFRIVLKILGANPSSEFVNFIYNSSSIFVAPFTGIFTTNFTNGIDTVSIFEPATLIAFVVYAVLAWSIVSLIKLIFGRQRNDQQTN